MATTHRAWLRGARLLKQDASSRVCVCQAGDRRIEQLSESVYKQRQLRFGQAVLLGVEFTTRSAVTENYRRIYSKPRWFFTIPLNKEPDHSYVSGGFLWRHEAVDHALKAMGIEA
jgi:hypothetical protein